MEILSPLLGFLSIAAFLVFAIGLIKPSWIRVASRKQVLKRMGIAFGVFVVALLINPTPAPTEGKPEEVAVAPVVEAKPASNEVAKPEAPKEDTEKLRQEVEKAKAEAETAKAEAEKAKAEAEQAKAAAESEKAKLEQAKADAAKAAESEQAKADAEKAQAEQAKIDAEKAEAEKKKAECGSHDLMCLGDKFILSHAGQCKRLVESMAKYDYKWTDGFLGLKFDDYHWKSSKKSPEEVITIKGNQLQMQNGFGAFQRVNYECDIQVSTKEVIDARVKPYN